MGKINNKKSQIAIYIVLGLIMLASAFMISQVTSRTKKMALEKEHLGQKPGFAGQSELRQYVDACIRPNVLQGLEIIRLQGGYVNIPPDTKTMLVKDKENKQVKEIDGSKQVVVDPSGEGNEVPYWLIKDKLAVPTLSFMEKELEEYVLDEVIKCINDFEPFREQKYDVEYGDVNIDVEMEKAVVTDINFPITMKRGDTEMNEEDFVYTVPIDMHLVQDRASDLVLYETVYSYLEYHTSSLISLYSGVKEDRLPPFLMSMTNLDCSQVTWSKSDVKEMLKAIFEKNLPYLKVAGTDFELPQTQNPISKGVYESFVHDLFDGDYPNIKVDFSYRSEWEFNDYDIKPSQGDSLMPSTVRENKIPFIPLICVLEYSHKYTIDYPVFIEIKDSESARIDPEGNAYFESEGFKFQFLLDSYLCGNQKRECVGRTPLNTVKASIVKSVNDKSTSGDTNFLSLTESLDQNLLPESYFCDTEQRVSNDITINMLDGETGERLEDVDIFYYCGSYQNDCFVGRTDANGTLKTKFPLCINGIIYFMKKDYAELKKELTVYNEPNRTLTYRLNPIKEFDVEVKKIDIASYVRNYHETGSLDIDNVVYKLGLEEKAMIAATGQESMSYIYPDPTNRKAKISPGSYNLQIMLTGDVSMRDSSIMGQPIKGFKGQFLVGTINMKWDVFPRELSGKRNITFYSITQYAKLSTWNDISDPILTDEGISAELLYRCEKIITNNNPLQYNCDYSNCNFVAVDGAAQEDFEDNSASCEKAYKVEIVKEQYQDYLKPKFS